MQKANFSQEVRVLHSPNRQNDHSETIGRDESGAFSNLRPFTAPPRSKPLQALPNLSASGNFNAHDKRSGSKANSWLSSISQRMHASQKSKTDKISEVAIISAPVDIKPPTYGQTTHNDLLAYKKDALNEIEKLLKSNDLYHNMMMVEDIIHKYNQKIQTKYSDNQVSLNLSVLDTKDGRHNALKDAIFEDFLLTVSEQYSSASLPANLETAEEIKRYAPPLDKELMEKYSQRCIEWSFDRPQPAGSEVFQYMTSIVPLETIPSEARNRMIDRLIFAKPKHPSLQDRMSEAIDLIRLSFKTTDDSLKKS